MGGSIIKFESISPLSLDLTLDCGQSFRWSKAEDDTWHGVAFGRAVNIKQTGTDITIYGDVREGDEVLWRTYLDLDRDYGKICRSLCEDEKLKEAITSYEGIRILRQDGWEALCSFIISQNNNIPRIKGIIQRLCENFGEELTYNDYSFPSAERLSKLTVDDLAPLRSGFRAKYIIDAAQKVATGEVDIELLKSADMDEARAELVKIKGVGAKVAECTLLYGCGRMEAFPVDVWVRRIMGELYPKGLPACTRGVEGIAQQYLFHWRRNIEK